MTKFNDFASNSPSYYKILSPCGRHSIPLKGARFFLIDLNGPGLPNDHSTAAHLISNQWVDLTSLPLYHSRKG